ncbi:MAG: hypothetical protein A3I75_05335 [Deltaproteobacteria bacterium RIFCSPLOWO2_02_FULL_50_16]|nr:MAG: hypothetical protein A2053_00065 [Deltaproteobacteria bacterium GWA2_50_8]OGQ30271.1 MAG: hypothetical protein A3B79_03710 [Deltaproteobacteria bacterium RIFCSPHIGHO2_02_FULL_50_15]OGQ57965.1 MAG: hypothetical protein A3I75_05335 [Deltaproteobacteria bacterium RIFCSPLOWO2_02_FULL_50_16]OGQ66341.1 MAG: hypothetical protein A3F89_01840 [Deltaproteobacteria bacterium RIFCSPLOWO2_12_FULL_50_11]
MSISIQEKDNLTRWHSKIKNHFESYNVKLINHETSQSIEWIYSLVQSKKGIGKGGLRAILYNASPRMETKTWQQSYALNQVYVDREIFFLQMGEAALYNTGLRGHLSNNQETLSWDLKFENSPQTFHYIPFPLMKHLKVFQMKRFIPNTNLHIRGEIDLHNQSWSVKDGWGQQNHLWGNVFPQQWLTFICPRFSEASNVLVMGWRTAVLLRGKPLMALYIQIGSETYRFPTLWGSVHCPQGVNPLYFTFEATQSKKKFVGQITSEPSALVSYEETDPSGARLIHIRTMMASFRFLIYEKKQGRWDLIRSLNAPLGCSYSLGAKENHPLYRQLCGSL